MEEFIKDVQQQVGSDDALYVALNKEYWIEFDEFVKLTTHPKIWDELSKGTLGEWDGVDSDFRIVLKDGGWISYRYCYDDPYYSSFVYNKTHDKPSKKYYEN